MNAVPISHICLTAQKENISTRHKSRGLNRMRYKICRNLLNTVDTNYVKMLIIQVIFHETQHLRLPHHSIVNIKKLQIKIILVVFKDFSDVFVC